MSLRRPGALLALPVLLSCSVVDCNRRMTARSYERLGLSEGSVVVPAGKISYRRGGRGFPLLLIHGFGFGALETWEHQVGDFVKVYQLIAPDLLWFGGSAPSAGLRERTDTAAEQADAIAALLDRLAVSKAHVVGVSFGGFVAIELARRHPRRIGRLVLVDPAGLQPTAAEQRQISANFGNPAEIADVLIPKDVDGLKRFLDTIFHEPRWIPRFALKEILEKEFWKNKRAKRRILERLASGGQLRSVELGAIRVETLVVWGRHDPLLLPSIGRRMVRALPRARLVMFDESGHSPMLEEPDRFNRVVLEFLARGLR